MAFNFHNRIGRSLPALIICTAVMIAGCGSRQSEDDAVRARINGAEWPRCSALGGRTVFDAYFEGEEFADRLILAGKVSSVLEELESSRDRFRTSRDLIEIFPTLLFNETEESLKFAFRPKLVHKIEFLRIVLNTYDAYKKNRDAYDIREPDSVDRHWRAYFSAAEKAQESKTGSWSPEAGVDVLLEGVNAHILYDLPRAIRDVTGDSDIDKNELYRDFLAADSIYPLAEERLKKQLLTMFRTRATSEKVQTLFGNGSEYVKFSRQKAWEMGVGVGPLGVIEEQPHLDHDPKSRKYFPGVLIKRGICR